MQKSITFTKEKYKQLRDFTRRNMNRKLMRYFDWPLLIIVLALSLCGVLAIFSATASPVETQTQSFLELVRTQPTHYASSQLQWIGVGLVAVAAVISINYSYFNKFATLMYVGNIALLLVVLVLGRGRGDSNMFYSWGESRTFQPAEIGKLVIIISLAKLFSRRKNPIRTVKDFIWVAAYVGIPMVLIVIQPDVGTALVYVAIFAVLLFASGTDAKLLIGIGCVLVIALVPLLLTMEFSDSFRVERIQVWLDPSFAPLGAGLQTTNARIAAGSGGFWGKGMFSPGSFASLNYIPDDHTDFIFAIVCETFGFVGAGAIVLLFLLLLLRLVALARQTTDAFGSYLIIGVTAMIFFHVFENISMVIGLMPVTGIPLPFISYGGSNYMTNIVGIAMVLNVSMRNRARIKSPDDAEVARPIKL